MEMGSSSSSSQSPESFTGLKIGQKVYFEDAGIGVPAKSDGGLSSTGGLPPKKGRSGVVQGGQRPRCQVEGCKADLSDVKAYYSRHKVCGMHSKSPMVIVAGLQQRFCQQCSRFHQLPAFDQGKRSCRRRLAGHNERRRKPPPRSLLSTRFGNLSSFILENNSRAGGFLMDFTTYPRLNGRDSWPTTRASVFGNQPTAIAKFLPHPWQSNPENPPPDHLQGLANGTRYPGPCIPPEGFFSGVSDSNCALSLLSNQSCSSRNQALSLGANYLLNSNGSRTVQPAATHGAPINHFSGTWGFKGNEASNGSHELHSDLGLCQISHPASGQYCGEVELAQQSGRQYMEVEHSRAYDSSGQHMDWLL